MGQGGEEAHSSAHPGIIGVVDLMVQHGAVLWIHVPVVHVGGTAFALVINPMVEGFAVGIEVEESGACRRRSPGAVRRVGGEVTEVGWMPCGLWRVEVLAHAVNIVKVLGLAGIVDNIVNVCAVTIAR